MSWIILLIAGLLEVVWHSGHGYQYGVTFLGNENAACWNGVRHKLIY